MLNIIPNHRFYLYSSLIPGFPTVGIQNSGTQVRSGVYQHVTHKNVDKATYKNYVNDFDTNIHYAY